MSSSNATTRHIEAGLAGISLIILLYSLLILARPVSGFGAVLLLFLSYLAWRFVRAIERIAAAMDQ